MHEVKCPTCRARYRVPDERLDRPARCARCSEVFTPRAVAGVVADVDDLSGPAEGEALGRREPLHTHTYTNAAADTATHTIDQPIRFAGDPSPAPSAESEIVSAARAEAAANASGFGGYLRSLFNALLCIRKLNNATTIGVLILVLAVQVVVIHASLFSLVGILGTLVISGWYLAFQLNTVQDAAAGDTDLPPISFGDLWDGIALPLIKMLAAWMATLFPLLVALTCLVLTGVLETNAAATFLGRAMGGDYAALFDSARGGDAGLAVIALASLLLWPMMLLVVAVGGVGGLVRVDLMFVTIKRTLPAYLLVVLFAYAGVVVPGVVRGLALAALDRADVGLPGLFVAGAALSALSVYGMIFAMQAVGLYYHHFKRGFAWSWG